MNQKGFSRTIIIFAVVGVILIGAAGYFVFNAQTPVVSPTPIINPPPTPAPQTLLSSGQTNLLEIGTWKTYTNTDYKYRINYPSDWEITNITAQPSPAAVRFTKITKQNGKYINDAVVDVIVESNPLRKTPTEEWYREWVTRIPARISLEGVQIVETTFQGMNALKIDNHTIFFAKGFNMLRIKWHVAGDYDQSLIPMTEKIFDRMLSSFEFID